MTASSEFDAEDGYERPCAPPPEPAPPDQGRQPPDLMDRVLEETLAAAEADAPLEPAELEALKTVARRHRGKALCIRPVAAELVEAVFVARFARLAVPRDVSQRMVSTIAETLMEDPSSRGRLESLWARLAEAIE